MPSFTPRATVVRALAEREAELLGHGRHPRSGHALVALLWEGGGVAGRALNDVGLSPEDAESLRERLRALPDKACGTPMLGGASGAREAAQLTHDYIGTEHQLLAIINDKALDDQLFRQTLRARTRERVLEIIDQHPPRVE